MNLSPSSTKRPMLKRLVVAVFAVAFIATPALAESTRQEPKEASGGFSFDGPLGTHNQEQLQRGFKVWKEVCAACHSMKLVHFRDLGEKDGPFYDPKYKSIDNPRIKAIAADYQIADIDSSTGDPVKRPGTPADAFPSPYPNSTAAAAGNGGATPPDHSTIAKARDGGAAYIYSLLTCYKPVPKGLTARPGQNYNPCYLGDLASSWTGDKNAVPPGGFVAMAPPLKGGEVKFDDGAPNDINHEAADVAAFLDWASDPHATDRKQMGWAVVGYLLLLAGLTWLSYKRIWRNVSH